MHTAYSKQMLLDHLLLSMPASYILIWNSLLNKVLFKMDLDLEKTLKIKLTSQVSLTIYFIWNLQQSLSSDKWLQKY